MNGPHRCPNRPLALEDLGTPYYEGVLKRLDELLAREETLYLHPSKRWEYPWALERADLSEGSRVLDLGCGSSIFPVYLADRGYRVAAADLNPPGRPDRVHAPSIGYAAADLRNLPFAESSFDAVFCISVIEHLGREGLPDAFKEMGRVLKPGSRLLLTTDYYEDAGAEIWYEGPGKRFRVDWDFFDRSTLRRLLSVVEGFYLEGDLDLEVDWVSTAPRMLEFHGYPYTTVGFTLVKQ